MRVGDAYGEMLHAALDAYPIDSDLFGRWTAAGPVPKALRPIFRNPDDGSTGITSLAAAVAQVIAAQPDTVAQYRAGQTKVLGFLVGQVMKATGGKASPKIVNQLLRQALEHANA